MAAVGEISNGNKENQVHDMILHFPTVFEFLIKSLYFPLRVCADAAEKPCIGNQNLYDLFRQPLISFL